MEETYRGELACKQFGSDLAAALVATNSPSFGQPKPTRATLTTGLRLMLGRQTGAERLAWVKENREFVSLVEVWIEETGTWVARWTPLEGWL